MNFPRKRERHYSFDRSHGFHDYLLKITGTYRSSFSPPEMASYLCSVTGKRFFPHQLAQSEQSTIHAYLAVFDLSSLSPFISSYRRVCISFTASFLLARFLFPSLDVELSPLPLPTFSLLFPPPSPPPIPIDLLNQQLRNFQHQKSWRTRKMNDRPRCSNDPSLK